MFIKKIINKIINCFCRNSLKGSMDDPKELESAIAALKENNYQDAVNMALIFVNSKKKSVRTDALRICAFGESGLSNWKGSFDYFMALSRLEPSAHNLLQLSTTALMAGFIDEAHHWFDRAIEVNIETEEIPQARMHSNFLAAVSQSGKLREGMAHVEWLKRAYQTISMVDDHVLYMYGLPFFGVFLEKSFPILQACLPQDEIISWYQSMLENLDECGKKLLSSWLDAILKESEKLPG